jgi:hypothetical protein
MGAEQAELRAEIDGLKAEIRDAAMQTDSSSSDDDE